MQRSSNIISWSRNLYHLLLFRQSKIVVNANYHSHYTEDRDQKLQKYCPSLLQNTNNILPTFCRTIKSFHGYRPIMGSPDSIFQGMEDRFNGITIESSKEFIESENFSEKLQKSLIHWQATNRRTIWFKVATEHSEWVPHLTRNGFDFHHANAGYVILYRWLSINEPPNLPVYAHTMVGVGGIVLNDNDEILVITDRHALIPNSWKLPGGYAEPHEDLVDAAVREVREETGVETTFESLVSIRHTHNTGFGCSDLYVVIGLKPHTSQLIPCEREIARIQWMPIVEYLNNPNVHETNRHFLRTFLDYRSRGIRITCKKAVHQILKRQYLLYFIEEKPVPDKSSI